MSNFSNQPFPNSPPPRSNGAMIAWIIAAVFGAGFMLLLGAFGMYVYMDSRPVAQPDLANDQKARVVDHASQSPSETTHELEELAELDPTLELQEPSVRDQDSDTHQNEADRSTTTTSSNPVKQPSSEADSSLISEIAKLPDLADMDGIELAADVPGLVYDWSDVNLAYSFDLKVNPGGRDQESFTGRTTFKPSTQDPAALLTDEELAETTGTGFLIHPDGLIMTCAHVVEDAESVKVTVGEEIRVAKVIATDPANDLALLRIDGNNLPYLPIASPDDVNQGLKVRVFGFPLTELLGESIKITNGFVTGFSDGGSDIQIDATVNPGNSGGPVVDGSGQVIGVASQLLDGEGISSVGLAVGAGKIEGFLDRCKLPFLSGAAQPLGVNQIKDSVVFIRSDSATVNRENSKTLDFQSYYFANNKSGRSQHHQEDGTIVVDSRGHVSMQNEEPKTLPVIIQEVCQIGIEILPRADGQNSWSDSQTFFLTNTRTERAEREDPFGMRGLIPRGIPRGFAGPRFGGRGLGRNPLDPFGRDEEIVRETTVTSVASLTQRFRLKSEDEKLATFAKTYEIETVKTAEKGFEIELEFHGEFVYDKDQQRLTQGRFKGVATVKVDGERNRMPFEYRYDLISEAQLKKEAADRLARTKAEAERQERVGSVTSKRLDLYDPER